MTQRGNAVQKPRADCRSVIGAAPRPPRSFHKTIRFRLHTLYSPQRPVANPFVEHLRPQRRKPTLEARQLRDCGPPSAAYGRRSTLVRQQWVQPDHFPRFPAGMAGSVLRVVDARWNITQAQRCPVPVALTPCVRQIRRVGRLGGVTKRRPRKQGRENGRD